MKLSYKYKDGIMQVSLSGEMDHHSAIYAREETDRIIRNEHPNLLIVDMSGITFCDSSGLGYIMGRYKLMKSFDGDIVLLSPSEPVKKMVFLSGLNKLIKVEASDQ